MPYKNIMANTIAQEILDSGVKIPSLPDSAPRLMTMSRMPVDKIDIRELENLIQSDPVLFAQILNLANSPYYRTVVEVTGLRTAIMRIGLTETLSALYRYLFKNALPEFPKLKGFSDKEYWEESWACAIANRRLGDPRLMVESLPGELYIAGLLQGIGKLILAVYDPNAFDKCIDITRRTKKPLANAEFEIFKTTGSLVARKILESWNLPDRVCAAVAYWQSPESAEPEYREIAGLTQFACSIVRLSGIVSSCEGMERSSPESFLTDLSGTYILRNRAFPLTASGKQYKLVQEIVSLLDDNFPEANLREKMNISLKDSRQSSGSSRINNAADRGSVEKRKNNKKHASESVGKGGFFAWLKSLFRL
ncbi:putative Metal dependent phosphohydrolase (HD domain protein) [Desulfamplus magnetovallimortis]|uniref:Putative Metal dependent phosphohydrolase (HD domain protein) n=1 Tax=Desulfamplus magnetovallimortis TaxID=1246637 RepID=A0A1W1HAV8_9BACT|nr:HDOD domain-containing protein [Desulfamplus magnetovallimortis]SLM29576.1 putative Metal dependent phosphohydrolase (HD domain protein) [Desulfamplus magnetovallimortis]